MITKVPLNEAHSVIKPIDQEYSDTIASNSKKSEMRSVKNSTIKTIEYFMVCALHPSIHQFCSAQLTRRSHVPGIAYWRWVPQ